jgi:hypothetical protein
MADPIEKKVVVKTRDGKSSPGKVYIQSWTKSERLKRSFKFWGFIWLLALISVFLPGAHFFLVPTFLIAGPIVARYIFKQESMVTGGETICPQCSKPLPIAKGPDIWPLDDLCSLCQTHVTLSIL